MGKESRIPWCHHTFNAWRGCWKISCGCANCYADALSKRNPAILGKWGKDGTRVAGAHLYWGEPYRWAAAAAERGERQRVFSLSMGDWLEDWPGPVHGVQRAPMVRDRDHRWYLDGFSDGHPPGVVPLTLDDVRLRLLDTVRRTPELDWLLLSKRVGDWRRILTRAVQSIRNTDRYDELIVWITDWLIDRPPANVWVGVSVENQACADERIPALLEIPAAVRFLSIEPMLGPIDLSGYFGGEYATIAGSEPNYNFGIHWVIVGGESDQGGAPGRPFDLAWARSIRDRCAAAGVPFFMK